MQDYAYGRELNIKIKAIYILLTVLIISMITILLSGCHQSNISADMIIANEKIIQVKDFSVNSNSTTLKTSAKGTIFVKGTEGVPEHIQIVARIEIDPDDWGGVAFYIPKKWNVSSISSSYPENKAQAIPADYVSTWFTASDRYKWQKSVEIGRDRSYRPTGGGTGTVVINLVPDTNAMQQSETFDITVEVGSDEKNGIKIVGTDGTSIQIP
ncbi:hypothetical protein [Syntrophaceticus schinkii]|jgi:hypothetical protein|uniref:Uncharacterized protein n=1 Tax=Syntrophaceticus schinkii TaxID=499207 RepID=A0A0B7MJ02_9FIRM|nr:hypothetical protein [Syntrophaceticus schinkii]MDD2503299.1 hypothetical protein [Clostridia bacterium]CEO88178.1 conserved hypothetical protein [Syntrophaceticus schinkii]